MAPWFKHILFSRGEMGLESKDAIIVLSHLGIYKAMWGHELWTCLRETPDVEESWHV